MSHRAALYTIQVRPKRDKAFRPLGDFDEAGSSLIEVLADYLQAGFVSRSEDRTREVLVESSSLDDAGEELALLAKHGKSGVRATIVDGDGQLRLEQLPADSQLLSCACLFRLAPQQDRGLLAIHMNDGRGIKTLLDDSIRERFEHDYDQYLLRIVPYVERAVLDKAIEEDKIEKVKLVKLERPTDEAMAVTRRWIPGAAIGKFELSISARTRGQNLLADPVRRFFGADGQRGELVEFEGIEFDQASVQVRTEDGGQRTFNVERLQAGHAFTEELDDLAYEDGEPTAESLLEALGAALDRAG